MKCPRCHRDTYSAKWATCTACEDEGKAGRVTNKRTDVPLMREDVPLIPASKRTRGQPRKWASAAERKRAQRAKT